MYPSYFVQVFGTIVFVAEVMYLYVPPYGLFRTAAPAAKAGPDHGAERVMTLPEMPPLGQALPPDTFRV